MLTAQKAREKSNIYYLANLPIIEIVEILDNIETAVLNGKTVISTTRLDSISIKYFKRLGYSVYVGNYVCNYQCYISWEKTCWQKFKECIKKLIHPGSI
jgi:hypothetical protein